MGIIDPTYGTDHTNDATEKDSNKSPSGWLIHEFTDPKKAEEKLQEIMDKEAKTGRVIHQDVRLI